MDAQEIFNKVATHLFAQGRPALNGSSCVYQARGGATCSAGVLIPDELYVSCMEGHNVMDLVRDYRSLADLWDGNVHLIQDLQKVHDGTVDDSLAQSRVRDKTWGSTEAMRSKLATVAATHDLNASVLDTLHFEDR